MQLFAGVFAARGSEGWIALSILNALTYLLNLFPHDDFDKHGIGTMRSESAYDARLRLCMYTGFIGNSFFRQRTGH